MSMTLLFPSINDSIISFKDVTDVSDLELIFKKINAKFVWMSFQKIASWNYGNFSNLFDALRLVNQVGDQSFTQNTY
jgi:hypothetical protein